MKDDVLAYLLDRQRDEGVSATAMARRLGLSVGLWCHIRKGRRHLTVAQIDRAIALYPEILVMLAARKSAPVKVAS